MSELKEANRRRKLAEVAVATAEAEYRARVIRSAKLVEAWGDVVPWYDYPLYDDDRFTSPRFSSGYPASRIDDRMDGRYRPLYETEYQLAEIRGQARNLAAYAPVALGAIDALANYTIGKGFEVTVQGEDELGAAMLQQYVDAFLESVKWHGQLDRDVHDWSRIDGEVLLSLYPDRRGGLPHICQIEPDQLTEPRNGAALAHALGVHEPSAWWLGVHTRYDRDMHCYDTQHPLGYYIVFDSTGNDWDYIPASRMIHVKRNVKRSALRGVSDFFGIFRDLDREMKLKANTAEGAAIQAAIAFIREHPAGVTKDSIKSFVSAGATSEFDIAVKSGTQTRQYERFTPGTVKDITAGAKYHAGPMGTLNSAVYIEVAQYLMRMIGIRWQMPEYIISGDSSNASFASTLVAESPFVKARERDQQFYIEVLRELIAKAMHLTPSVVGRLGADVWSRYELEIHGPEVASRDKAALAATAEVLHRNGILSSRTWATQSGLDYDEELENMSSDKQPGGELGESYLEHVSVRNPEHHKRGADPSLKRGRTKERTTARAERAKATHKPSTKEIQVAAHASEKEIVAALGGTHIGGLKPFDLTVEIGGKLYAGEIKTIVDNKNNKITMHPESRRRKEKLAAKKPKAIPFTVVIDARETFAGGKNKGQYSGHRMYVAKGYGAFRLGGMQRTSGANLKAVLTKA